MAIDDPKFGCGPATCTPCFPDQNAARSCSASCVSGACAIAACAPGLADCDGLASNGCEANLNTAANCRACGTQCPAGQVCSSAGCVSACTPPETLCRGDHCANLLTDPNDCGGCGTSGAALGAFSTCSNGVPGEACQSGFTLCFGSSCIDTNSDANNCGGCGIACSGSGDCVHGSCGCGLGQEMCSSVCTSTQSDSLNCGGCGHDCGSGQLCVSGSCTNPDTFWIATGLSQPAAIATDGVNVYWTDTTDNAVYAMPTAGGAMRTIASGQAGPVHLVIDDTSVYWSNNLGGAIMSALKDGSGSPAVVAATTQPSDIVVDADNVYWLAATGPNNEFNPVLRAPKTGLSPPAQPFVLGPGGLARSLASDGTALVASRLAGTEWIAYRLDKVTGVESIALYEAGLFGGSDVCGYRSCGPCGNTWLQCLQWSKEVSIVKLVGIGFVGYVDGCGAFMAGAADGPIYLFSEGGQYNTKLITSGTNVRAMTSDATYLYWADATAIGRVRKP